MSTLAKQELIYYQTQSYCSSEKKDLDTLNGFNILKEFASTLTHDHEAAMYHFGNGHSECNVHLKRYLLKNTEETGNEWSHCLGAVQPFEKVQGKPLVFLKDFQVHYSNNMSEKDFRICKNRQKMAGGFRTESGREMYCEIMSFIETVKRRGLNIFQSIIGIMDGTPVIK